MKRRKIHAQVDTDGLPLRVVVHSAGVQDRDGAALVLAYPLSLLRLELVWADAGSFRNECGTQKLLLDSR